MLRFASAVIAVRDLLLVDVVSVEVGVVRPTG
jgi:hypothetical protein